MSLNVIMPGGFHPFHAGHRALYEAAQKAFPGANIYIAATNDTKTRPFPFSLKEKLARLSGVKPGQFVQVKSPFQPREITENLDPNSDVVVFVRSEKDKNEHPIAGGTKKDGTSGYFQPWDPNNMQAFGKHAHVAYLPTVEFGPGITSATEIRDAWPRLNDKRKQTLVMSLYPAAQKNPQLAKNVTEMFDQVLGGQQLSESRIMDRDAKINAYYIARNGNRHKVAEGIPYYLLDRLVGALTKKYNITMDDIEVRPADISQYHRTEHPEMAEGFYRVGINELTVNKNKETHQWQLRNDQDFSLVGDVDSVVLKDVEPVIGAEALDSGRNVFAYLRGEKANGIPEGLTPFTIFFKRDLKNPFIDKDTGESVEHADYVKFDKSGAVIGYKQAVAESKDEDEFGGDLEVQQLLRKAQQHYPHSQDKQQAFVKYAQRALKHSEEEDTQQDQEIAQLQQDVSQIKDVVKKLQVTENADYLEEK